MADDPERPDDLPRERLARLGVSGLGDSELLALVLGHGMAGRSARDIATTLLRDVGGIHGLTRVSGSRLERAPGVGAAQASRVIAAIELGRRTLHVPARERLPLDTPATAAAFLLPRFGAYHVERLGVVLLDSRHRLIRVQVVSEGTLDRTIGLPRDVFREAAIDGASAVLLFHNHPSGDPAPTRDDVALTVRLVAAGHIVGIDVVDHLILADDRYCSLREAKAF